MCAGRQSGRQAIDGDLLETIHHPADAAFGVDPVQAAILPAGVFRTNLIGSLKTPEMPVDVVGGADIGAHGIILLRNKNPATTEHLGHRE